MTDKLTDAVYWIQLLNGWGALALTIAVAIMMLVLYRMNKGPTPFKLGDSLIDPSTGKASVLRVAFVINLGCSWAVIFYYVVKGEDIPPSMLTAILGVLGIFVTPVIANRALEIWDPRTKALAINSAPELGAAEVAAAGKRLPSTSSTTIVGTNIEAASTTGDKPS